VSDEYLLFHIVNASTACTVIVEAISYTNVQFSVAIIAYRITKLAALHNGTFLVER
jgi:hypothetical protein